MIWVKMVWEDHFGPGGPNLAATISMAQPKMVCSRIYTYHLLQVNGMRPHSGYKCGHIVDIINVAFNLMI